MFNPSNSTLSPFNFLLLHPKLNTMNEEKCYVYTPPVQQQRVLPNSRADPSTSARILLYGELWSGTRDHLKVANSI
jgi:hypothetical protein